jgi:hypothetical protein
MKAWIVKNITKCLILAALGLGGCGVFGGGQSPTSTPSSADVLQTAQAIAQATRQASSPTPSRTPITPSATLPAETDTPAPTSTPSAPLVKANYNAYIRTGPDEAFDYVDFLLEGKTAQVLGQYQNLSNGVWWYIHPDEGGLEGWVWGGAVTFSGNAGAVPARESPPTPTKAPTATEAKSAMATSAASVTPTSTPG